MADDDALTGSTDNLGPWTIKVMPKSVRDMTVAAARDEGLTVGQWLERVIRERVASGRPSPIPATNGHTNVEDLVQLVEAARALKELPPDIETVARAGIKAGIRQARGLPPFKPRQPKQTAQAMIEGPGE